MDLIEYDIMHYDGFISVSLENIKNVYNIKANKFFIS